ncbi:MAG TPA: single-stranded-DNA-specific exonuclease RecJ, partial [Ruminiclostridium sp.]|nr:single-stranded-DNA-specific exonuclease RecJ [Ruminiclostridium sp.]
MIQREWRISQYDKDAAAVLHGAGFSRVLSSLLALRGIKTPEEAKGFLICSGDFFDPMLMLGMDKAAARIEKALELREKITVYGDYDADGVTATALLYSYLKDNGAD